MKSLRYLILTPVVLFLVSCATVRDHRGLSQAEDTVITASVGSTLFRLSKSSDLPNAVGGRDIYGGKVDRGYAEVKLVGIEDRRRLSFLVFDVSRESSENTMGRYGRRAIVDVDQSVNVGTSSDQGIPVVLDTKEEKEYTVAGVKITILEVRASSISYKIHDTQD